MQVVKRGSDGDSLRGMRAVAIALLLTACGGLGARPASGPELVGVVTFDARHPTPQGTSEALEERPARHVELAVLDATGRVLAEGRCDAEGRFRIEAPAGAARLRVAARVRVRGLDVAIARDAGGRETHVMEVPIDAAPAGGATAPEMRVHAVDETGDAGAFHVVDTLLRGLDAVHAWTGETLPPLFVYWVRGGTREWSFYRGERPAGSGRFALELLGGDPGQASVSDTDEHDEAIILHELGHFVMDRLTSDSSTGGMHPRGARIDPGVAWEEGRATWFALAVLGAPAYQDTIGVQPWGRLRVDEDLEAAEDPFPGMASETSVSKVLWDLSDGVEGLPDADDDGIALGAAPILEAMMAHAREPGAFPSLPSFLRHLGGGRVPEAELRAMLTATGEPADELLPGETLAWPRDLGLGESVTARLDGLSQPAPSGGPNLPITGLDANHTYRVRVERAGMLVVRMDIAGDGQAASRTDLDLELRDLDAELLADGRTESPREALARLVQPGWYIVKVRDGGRGNRAEYRLTVDVESL